MASGVGDIAMQKQLNMHRWPLFLVLLLLAFVITACPPRTSLGGIAANRNTKTTPQEASTEDGANLEEPQATPTPFFTPTPLPEPTATPTPLAQPDADASTALVDEARALFLQSDLSGAEAKAIEAIAVDASNVAAYLQLTDVYLYMPQYWQQALQSAETTAGLQPDNPVVLAYLAWAQQGAHLFDEARQSAERAVEIGPDNAIAHQALADVLNSVYDVDAAYEHAQRAVELDDGSAGAWATLGSIAGALEYPDEASEAYERAVELEPEFFAWHILLARHELNLTGDVEAARELAAPAIEVQPDHPFVLSFIVDTAIENNEWDLAEETCVRLMAYNQPHTPYPDAYSCMASVKLFLEDSAGAEYFQAIAEEIAPPQRLDISVLRMRLLNDQEACAESRKMAEAWLEQRPYSVLALRMIGVSYLCDEDFPKAEEYFQQALERLPRSIADARLLANAYARDQKAAEARAVLNQISSFAAENPLYYQALYEVHLFLGQTKEAIRAAQRWRVFRPNSTDAMINLALAELFDNNPAAAQNYAQNALNAGATGATLYAVLGESYSRAGNFEQAEKYLQHALAINSDHFLARNFMAQLYLLGGQCDKAEPHINWLKQEAKGNDESVARYDEYLALCRKRAATHTPDPATALDDAATLAEVARTLQTAGVESRSAEFAADERQRSLFVAFSSDIDADSVEFAELEHTIAIELARLLPRITSQPDGLLLLTGANDKPQNILFISTQAAHQWVNGELTDAEFEETWLMQNAEDLGEE
jgi:tetratricopeptide (TPR) repeat protein